MPAWSHSLRATARVSQGSWAAGSRCGNLSVEPVAEVKLRVVLPAVDEEIVSMPFTCKRVAELAVRVEARLGGQPRRWVARKQSRSRPIAAAYFRMSASPSCSPWVKSSWVLHLIQNFPAPAPRWQRARRSRHGSVARINCRRSARRSAASPRRASSSGAIRWQNGHSKSANSTRVTGAVWTRDGTPRGRLPWPRRRQNAPCRCPLDLNRGHASRGRPSRRSAPPEGTAGAPTFWNHTLRNRTATAGGHGAGSSFTYIENSCLSARVGELVGVDTRQLDVLLRRRGVARATAGAQPPSPPERRRPAEQPRLTWVPCASPRPRARSTRGDGRPPAGRRRGSHSRTAAEPAGLELAATRSSTTRLPRRRARGRSRRNRGAECPSGSGLRPSL